MSPTKFVALVVAAVILAVSLIVQAAFADSVIINGLSIHGGEQKFNEVNYGLGYRLDSTNGWYYHGGAYHNSEWNTSAYVLVGKRVVTFRDDVHISLEAGIVTGYSYMPVAPAVLPVLTVGHVRALYIPPACDECTYAVGFQWEVKL